MIGNSVVVSCARAECSLKNYHTRQPKFEDETTTLLQNIRHLSPGDAAPYPRIQISTA
jgi:hypothetical protein